MAGSSSVWDAAGLDRRRVDRDRCGSNALFGNLQKVTARQLQINPVLMGSANSAGGVMGKMISPQSLVRRRVRDQLGRQRGGNVQGNIPAQHSARLPGRPAGHDLRPMRSRFLSRSDLNPFRVSRSRFPLENLLTSSLTLSQTLTSSLTLPQR